MTARLKSLLAPLGRSAVTIVIVALAVLVALWLWKRYETDPWTRDGHIRADIVRVTPDVAGALFPCDGADAQSAGAGADRSIHLVVVPVASEDGAFLRAGCRF